MDLPRHEPMQRALRPPRMPRRIDEDGLIGAAIQHAEHALARRMRLVRDDAELLADERVQQRRLADVRPADDRDEAAAAGFCFSAAHRSAPRASPRQLPAPLRGGSVLDRSFEHSSLELRTRRRTSARDRGHARPSPRTTARASPLPCNHSCSRVFGSLSAAASGKLSNCSANMRSTTASAAAAPPSSNTAPINASTASARIAARCAPPVRSSPATERQMRVDAEVLADSRERRLLDERGASAAQVAFGVVADAARRAGAQWRSSGTSRRDTRAARCCAFDALRCVSARSRRDGSLNA